MAWAMGWVPRLGQAAWQWKEYGLHQEASGWLDVEL